MELNVRRILIDRFPEKSNLKHRRFILARSFRAHSPVWQGEHGGCSSVDQWWWEPLVCSSINLQCGFIHKLEAQEAETGPERAPRYPPLSATPPIPKAQQPSQTASPVSLSVQTQDSMGNIRLESSHLLLYMINTPPQCIDL